MVAPQPVVDGSLPGAGGIRLGYRASGPADGAPMLLLHALGEDGGDWEPVVGRFAESFRVLTVDLRGHGRSDRPGEYSYRLMRDDVLAALDELHLPPVVLVGHSLGGIVAYHVAVARPAQIARLVVEDAPPPFPRERAQPERPEGPLPFDWAVVPALYREANAGDPALWDALPTITAATLLIGGGADSHIPQHTVAEVAARIPDCELVTIPAGHHVHRARPEEFAEVTLRFLRAGGADGGVRSGRTGPARRP